MIKICKKENIDVVFPGSDAESIQISKNYQKLVSQKIVCPVCSYDTIKIITNKAKMLSYLKENGVSVPDFFVPKNLSEFKKAIKALGYPKNPVCFKHSKLVKSGGSKGFRVLRDKNNIQKIILNQKPSSLEIDFDSSQRLFQKPKLNLIVSEFLPGEEYSVYILAKNGKMIHCIPLLRQRIEQGFAFEAKVVKNKKISDICKTIVKVLNFDHLINIQLKKSKNGKLKLVEINPRIAGAISLPVAAGVNLPYFALKQVLDENLPKCTINYSTKMIRYWKELYIRDSKSYELS